MSPSLSRLILSVVFLASVLLVAFFSGFISDQIVGLNGETQFFAAMGVASIYLVLGWLAVWRGAIHWTPWRSSATAISVIACMIPATIPMWLVTHLYQ